MTQEKSQVFGERHGPKSVSKESSLSLQTFRVRMGLGNPPNELELSIDALLSDLFSSQWATRVTAIRTLEILGKNMPTRVIRALTNTLQDGSEHVRAAAAQALGQLEEGAPKSRLLLVVRDPAWEVRASAVQALGKLGEQAPAETLVAALQQSEEPEPAVRAAAASALGRLKRPDLLTVLAAALHDEDPFVRLATIQALKAQGEDVPVEILVTALNDEDEDVRLEAIETLGARTPIEALLTALTDKDEDVRMRALQFLGALGERAPLESLLLTLEDRSERIQAQAHKLLGRLGDQIPRRISSEQLCRFLRDESAQLRAIAAWALGEQGTMTATASLQAALLDPNEMVRTAAAWSLQEIERCQIKASDVKMIPERKLLTVPRANLQTGEASDEQSIMVRFLSALTAYFEGKKGYVHPELRETLTERVLVLLCYCQDKGSSLQETILNEVASLTPIARLDSALFGRDEMVRMIAEQALERLAKRPWNEFFIVSLSLFQDAEARMQMKIPTRIVLCSMSLLQERDSDAPVLKQILTAFERESICAYSAKICEQTERRTEEVEHYGSFRKSSAESEAFAQSGKPDPSRLGKVLTDFQIWCEPLPPEICDFGLLNGQALQRISYS